jgi:predicted SAM-dependent methyltransferase
VRVNLGCGDRYVPGWVNVDLPDMPHQADMRLDVTGPLPEEWRGQVTHFYAGHILEHLDQHDAALLLNACEEIADPTGCLLMAVGPDVDVARAMIERGTFDYTYHSLDSILHGGHRWTGDDHQWETTAENVAGLLRHAGWKSVMDVGLSGVSVFWPVADRSQPWQYAVRAYTNTTGTPPW